MSEGLDYQPVAPGSQPDNNTPDYGSTRLRHPTRPLLEFPFTETEASGPRLAEAQFPAMADMSVHQGRAALGERIIVAGRVTDEAGRPVAGTMMELWQANASGRYQHPSDQHDAPVDPNFLGNGRVFTDADGRYSFISVKPGAYPWRNHHNAWRPNHIHFSLFGAGFASRLITQMYFPGDPLLALDPVFNAVPDPVQRDLLIARFDLETTRPEWALGYRFDIVLRGPKATPMEDTGAHA
jgi:protocatechuate 3,4-dioxygenase beta subunit